MVKSYDRKHMNDVELSSVQFSHSVVSDSVTPWTATYQASLFIINCQSLSKYISTELVMSHNHLILCRPLLLLPSNLPGIRVFSNESALCIKWPKYWSFSFNISQDWFPLGWTGWISLQSKGLARVFSKTTVQKHQFFGAQHSCSIVSEDNFIILSFSKLINCECSLSSL